MGDQGLKAPGLMYKSYNIRQQMQQIFYLKRPMKTFDRLRQLVSPWNERDYLSPSSLINKLDSNLDFISGYGERNRCRKKLVY